MGNIVASPWFHVAVVPLVLMLVGVFAKRLGRRDGDDSSRRNDWAVGTTVLLMLLGTILGDIRTAQGQILEPVTWLIGVLFTVFISIDHDRFRSWELDPQGNPLRDKRMFIGVISSVPTFDFAQTLTF
jgi:cytochrome c biogenesis factor